MVRPMQDSGNYQTRLSITPHGATAPADELPIEDTLAVEHDLMRLDGADVLLQRNRFHWQPGRKLAEAGRLPAAFR
jgi:hypothetical protein